MKAYDPEQGEDFAVTVGAMVKLAKSAKTTVVAYFNDVVLIATPESSEEDISNEYKQQAEYNRKHYSQTLAYQRESREERTSLSDMQSRHDKLVARLRSIDFNDYKALVRWLHSFQEFTEFWGVKCDTEKVIESFSASGFTTTMKADKSFNETDYECFARHIVCRALSQLKTFGHIKRGIISLIEMWQNKFPMVTV